MSQKPLSRCERRLEAADGYLLLEMPDHALRELDAVSDPEPVAFRYYQLRGEALRQKCRHEEALPAFERAHACRSDDLTVILGMAWCYKRTGQLPKAIAAMEDAYQSHSDEPIVLYNLSCYLALAGQKEQALSWLGRALRMQPSLRRLILDETDFDRLRGDPDFEFVAGLGRQLSEDSGFELC